MGSVTYKLASEALKLSPRQRARLARRIIASLDKKHEPGSAALWAKQGRRRLRELQTGRVKAKPAATVFRKARASLR
ncbi:MAG: addiction module protein [Candidatus Rokuibacteriota bacterium]